LHKISLQSESPNEKKKKKKKKKRERKKEEKRKNGRGSGATNDGFIGGLGMALATPQVLQKRKKNNKKRKIKNHKPMVLPQKNLQKKFISRFLPIELSRSVPRRNNGLLWFRVIKSPLGLTFHL
jgi:hypothetical protein